MNDRAQQTKADVSFWSLTAVGALFVAIIMVSL